jgi:cytosine/adenosine deaminase-related metal-dependent hydrolase
MPGEAFALGGIGRLQAGHVADAVVVDDDLSPQTVLRRAAWLTSG